MLRHKFMKQFLITASKISELVEKLRPIKQYRQTHKPAGVLVRAFLTVWWPSVVNEWFIYFRLEMPDVDIVGCGSNGSIVNASVAENTQLFIITFFETTQVETLTYKFSEGQEDIISNKLCSEVNSKPDVRAVELFTTLLKFDAHKFLDGIHFNNRDIKIFGSNVMGIVPNATEELRENAFIMSKNGIVSCGAVAVVYRGSDLHVETERVLGWKPLGMEMTVTKSTTRVVQEIDHKPAYEVYHHYLEIPNDENFVANTTGFPFLVKERGLDVLRIPAHCTPEGYLISNAGIPKDKKLRLTYGNPGEILADLKTCRDKVKEFAPQSVLIYDCILRKSFWGTGINLELEHFKQFPATAGFFSEGELSSIEEGIIHNECTFLVIAMREGYKVELPDLDVEEPQISSKEVSMLKRMATFVQTTTEALQTAYHQLSMLNRELEAANVRLSYMALTDELTQLFNRREIEQRIHSAFADARLTSKDVSLMMIDIDFFKKVNDTYGHAIGDLVLKGVAAIIQSNVNVDNDEAVGRWGGEEFIVLMPGYNAQDAAKVAEKLRQEISEHEFDKVGRRTVSIGVTAAMHNESEKEVFIRADNALYQAKENGRNQVVIL